MGKHVEAARTMAAAITRTSPWIETVHKTLICRWCHVESARLSRLAPEHLPGCVVSLAEQYRTAYGKKLCSKCRAEKPVDEFPRDSTRADNRCAYCKPCKREANLRYQRNTALRGVA